MKTIKILGGGVSGLSAAINLAKAGYKVDVFEKNREIGERFHGDLQGLENWSENEDILKKLKEMNIGINFDCDPFSSLIVSNGSRDWNFSCNKTLFYLVKRGPIKGSLDQGLKEQALKLGVNIYLNRTIPNDESDIIATGPILKEVFAVAKGITFKTSMKDIAVAITNDSVAFKGYSYLLVTKGHGCMCTALTDNFDKINNYFDKTRRMFLNMVNLDIKNEKNFGGVGCFSNKNIFKKGKSLYVGEAAGLQDLLWGFGIRSAVVSGFLAAKSIMNNEDYEKLARKYFKNRLKASLVNRFLWEKLSFNNYAIMVERFKSNPLPLKRLQSFYNFNILQKLIYPFALIYMRKRYRKLRL